MCVDTVIANQGYAEGSQLHEVYVVGLHVLLSYVLACTPARMCLFPHLCVHVCEHVCGTCITLPGPSTAAVQPTAAAYQPISSWERLPKVLQLLGPCCRLAAAAAGGQWGGAPALCCCCCCCSWWSHVSVGVDDVCCCVGVWVKATRTATHH
jgi:hypothetical protein